MVFSSLIFLWMFLPIVLGMYFLTKESYRNVLLLAASLFFYAWGEPVYVLVMILSIVINYIYGLKIGTEDETKRKRALVGGIVINLALLGVFKYSGFFMENVNAVFGLEVEVKKLPLPIGISFYTFQSISYLVDIYRRVCPPQKSLIKMGLFISFFPQLIAGPILKYYDIAAQIDNRKVSLPLFNQGAVRFLQGLAKKIIIANIMAKTADEIFALGINDISTPQTMPIPWTAAIWASWNTRTSTQPVQSSSSTDTASIPAAQKIKCSTRFCWHRSFKTFCRYTKTRLQQMAMKVSTIRIPSQEALITL